MVAIPLNDQNGLGVMSWGQRPGNGPPARTAVWEDASNLTPGSPQHREGSLFTNPEDVNQSTQMAPNAPRNVTIYPFGRAVPLNGRQKVDRWHNSLPLPLVKREPPAWAAASNSLSSFRRPASWDEALAVGPARPSIQTFPAPLVPPQYKLEEERLQREAEWDRRRVAGARLGNTRAAVEKTPPALIGTRQETVPAFASTLPRDPSRSEMGGEVVRAPGQHPESGLYIVKKPAHSRPTTCYLGGGGTGRVDRGVLTATSYPMEDVEASRRCAERRAYEERRKGPSGRQRTTYAPNSAVPRGRPTRPAPPALGGKEHLRANAAAVPAAMPSLRQFPEGGRVHPPPIEKGHLEYVQPTLVEALRGGASPKPPWVEMREARSTTCADKTFETHVGPFRQPASIHSPFPVRGRRPQLRAAAWPATAGALELRRTLRQSHALARDCMYVNADKMNGFGASDTSYGQVFEIAAPDLRRGGFRGPRR